MSFYFELAQSLSEVASKIKGIPQLTWTNLWKEEVQMVLLILFFLDYAHVIHEDAPIALTVYHNYDTTFTETIKECVW